MSFVATRVSSKLFVGKYGKQETSSFSMPIRRLGIDEEGANAKPAVMSSFPIFEI